MRFARPLLLCLMLAAPAFAQTSPFIILQSTTSTANSGLYDAILPQVKSATGIEVRVVAVGTGQALKNAELCDGDLLIVHAKDAEEKFVAAGFGIWRKDLMYNDFIVVGPADDPAKLGQAPDVAAGFRAIATSGARFASRGDDSGTHKAEMALWDAAGIDANAASGTWYSQTGSGMGATLNTAVGIGAYALSDRASWVTFANKSAHLIAYEGDSALFNQYGIIAVNPAHCPQVKAEAALAVAAWFTSPAGQAAIAGFRVGAQQLFFPNAKQTK